jgi:Ca2+-transporting ATPase
MLKEANLVRHLKACEVMGNATTICTDETGTLTQNKMQVVAGTLGTSHRFGGKKTADQGDDGDHANHGIGAAEFASTLSEPIKGLPLKSIALNSNAFEGEGDGQKTFIGSKTETALPSSLATTLGPVAELRESATTLQLIPFDSGRQCMGIVVRLPNACARLYIKDASEIVLGKCSQILRDPAKDDSLATLTEDNKDTITRLTEAYASRSLRTIIVSFGEFES